MTTSDLEHALNVIKTLLLVTLPASNNHFGFKKHLGCSHAIYLLRCVTDYY